MKTFLQLLLISILAAVSFACSHDDGLKVTLTVTPANNVELAIGDSLQLMANYSEGGRTEPITGKWNSSDENVLTINNNGLAKPLKEGSVTVTALFQSVKSNEVMVTVIADENKVVKVLISAPKTTLSLNESVTFDAVAINSKNAPIEGKSVNWTTEDADIVYINKNGIATGLGPGKATIWATVDNVKSDTILISVN